MDDQEVVATRIVLGCGCVLLGATTLVAIVIPLVQIVWNFWIAGQ